MSVPANLVEGVGQRGSREFGRFKRIALKSANELEYHLQIASDFRLLPAEDFEALVSQTIQVRKMLHGLLRSIESKSLDATPRSKHRSSPATGHRATRNPERVIPEAE
jgi:hypothetical protein